MNVKGETTEQIAEAAFSRAARIHQAVDQEISGEGYLAEDRNNISVGQNILREEIGFFGPYGGQTYKLDDETRDLLIAHGRQDAASALAMSRSAFREAHSARRVAVRATLFSVVSIMLNIAILATLWLSP